jgi:hypothetical protein
MKRLLLLLEDFDVDDSSIETAAAAVESMCSGSKYCPTVTVEASSGHPFLAQPLLHSVSHAEASPLVLQFA